MSPVDLDIDLLPPLADARRRLRAGLPAPSERPEPRPRRPRATAPRGFVKFQAWARDLRWIDGRPLLDTVEPYRLAIFEAALDTFEGGRVKYTMALASRAKKNWKSSDLVIAALFKLDANQSPNGNQAYIVANDKDQASDDLEIAKAIYKANPKTLGQRLRVQRDVIRRKDGLGFLEILPKGDVAGAHGKTYCFLGFDEIHAYTDYGIFEALAVDPTRADAQVWVTSYASLNHQPGIPLYDFFETGKLAADPRMLFSWYAADYCTDPAMEGRTPEERANPSMGSTFDPSYLDGQRKRLPVPRFNRLHLNLPGLPEGSAFTLEKVMAAVDKGVTRRERERYVKYHAFVDMSGGSSDDAALCVAHEDPRERGLVVVDLVVNQMTAVPFDPEHPVRKWVPILDEWGIKNVYGDSYGGEVFAAKFRERGVLYNKMRKDRGETASDLYEAFEVTLNAGKVRLLDLPKVNEQALALKWSGGKIVHPSGQHDDWVNAVAGAVYLVSEASKHRVPDGASLVSSVRRSTDGYIAINDGRGTEVVRQPFSTAVSRQHPSFHPHERDVEPLVTEADETMGRERARRWRNAWGDGA